MFFVPYTMLFVPSTMFYVPYLITRLLAVTNDHLSKVIKSAGEGPLPYGFEQALLLKGFENSSH